jgi:hypothetical protein
MEVSGWIWIEYVPTGCVLVNLPTERASSLLLPSSRRIRGDNAPEVGVAVTVKVWDTVKSRGHFSYCVVST